MVAESVLLADTVWIVDDSPDYRRLLAMIQTRWQYRVIAAQESEQVLTCLASHRMHIVTMPLMEGAALCQTIHARDYGYYIYLILLAPRQSTEDMLAGVATCADGFLTKCLNQGQLRSRLHAVQRIISQETTLAVLNAMLSRAHQQIASDLQAFAAMQRKLLTSYGQTIDGLHADGLFVTPAYMSDDLLNYVLLDAYHPAFYGVDVAGHGVSAAMLVQEFYSASLIHSQRFSPSVQRSVLPYRVVSERNRRFSLEPLEDGVGRYFTLGV